MLNHPLKRNRKEINIQQKRNIDSEIKNITEEINNAPDSHRIFNINNRKKPIVIHNREGHT